MSYASTSKSLDTIQTRGDKGPSPLGTSTFLGLRTADVFLQYAILRHSWGISLINRLGGAVLSPGPAALTNTPLDALGLSPYRLVLLGMAAGSTAKQAYWLTALSYERMLPVTGVVVSAFNTAMNSLNHLLFICRQTSASANGERFPQTPLLVGSVLYVAGMILESVSETQRYLFKKDPKNKGKVYQGGLFSMARHVNYTGYLFWRTGYAVAAGGYAWGLINMAFFSFNFSRTITPLNHYCEERVSPASSRYVTGANRHDQYGQQWEQYKRQTPYKMIPGLW